MSERTLPVLFVLAIVAIFALNSGGQSFAGTSTGGAGSDQV